MNVILVTGGAGFIGSHLCQRLLEDKNNEVICIDNLSSGKIENVKELESNKRFQFINEDITNSLPPIAINQIYHLACPASPIKYQSDPISTLKTNAIGTINMLGLSLLHEARILLTSTSEIYGDPLESPQVEEYWGNVNPIGDRSCYNEGKRFAESAMIAYHNKYGVDIRIARIFNTYGPKMAVDDGRVISNFIIQCLRNQDITIYGNGAQTRSFCYVDDIVRGLISLMNYNEYPGPVNIGNPDERSIIGIAYLIVDLTKRLDTIFNYFDLPQDDPKRRCPNIDKAKKLLNWQPKTTLRGGLIKTINYFEAIINYENK